MLKTYKNKGVSLIELMVAVGLSLTLVLSMLAFYSVSSRNVVDFQASNHDQQQIRKMMNLLETDIENTGGFECAKESVIFATEGTNTEIYRVPHAIISLGQALDRQQIIFVHPIISEYQYTALGMFDFNKQIQPNTLKSYHPLLIADAGCGQDKSPIHIGTTILEMLPMDNIITTDTEYTDSKRASVVNAFVALSAAQSRRYTDNNGDIKTISTDTYTPNMNDATVMFLSDESDSGEISVGRNKVDILLGFAPIATANTTFTHVPERNITSEQDLPLGGWINPFDSESSTPSRAYYDLITDQSQEFEPTSQLLNHSIHHSTNDGYNNKTYPLKKDLVKQLRAIKFKFTFGAHDGKPERTLTRVIRFKNTHLMKLETSNG